MERIPLLDLLRACTQADADGQRVLNWVRHEGQSWVEITLVDRSQFNVYGGQLVDFKAGAAVVTDYHGHSRNFVFHRCSQLTEEHLAYSKILKASSHEIDVAASFMLAHGGGFVVSLAEAFVRADSVNRGRLLESFPIHFLTYMEEYAKA